MNRTNFEHAAFALLMQAVIGLLTGNWFAGACFGAAFFIGREHTQAEYRWIQQFGNGKRAGMPWWGGLDVRVWNKVDSWLDWVVPLLSVYAFTI